MVKHYFDENGTTCYFAVILRDVLIDVKKYRSGRINTELLEENEHIICFKKIINKENEVHLFLREKLNEETLSEADLSLYSYIKENCGFESY